MSTTLPDYAMCIQRLFTDIGYRFEPFPPYDTEYWGPFHDWTLYTLGPSSTWNVKQLTELEHSAGGIIERAYPYASTQLKLLFAKLTAIAILIDDSIEDESVHAEIVQFSHKLYLGEKQENRMLALYHQNISELSAVYEKDTVLRGLATVPWINYIDACLMEKQIFDAERDNVALASTSTELKAPGSSNVDGLAVKFPHYLRSKSGIAEAYAAAIFKANKEQHFPLTKYIKVLPDLTFYIEVMNDLLSFHKEEIAGETYNLIHLRTRALECSGARGSGILGGWTCTDTVRLLCDEMQEATRRIDGLLRMEDCERKMLGEPDVTEVEEVEEVDIKIARQWRGFRDGYISWHLECRRYKLGFMRAEVVGEPL